MILSMSNQAVLFLFTVLLGLFCGFIYDLFRIFRMYVKHSDMFTHFEDILYWIFISGVMFYLFLNKNYGEIRGFCILGAAIGMIIYFFSLSKLIVPAFCLIINFIIKVFEILFKIITFPFRLICKILRKPVLKIKSIVVKFLKKFFNAITNYVKIKRKAAAKDIDIILKKV